MPIATSVEGGKTCSFYDGAGAKRLERTRASNIACTAPSTQVEVRASYVTPDGRLVASDRRISARRTLEEYRFDALGRRVWVSTRTQCGGAAKTIECWTSAVRRTIWDGAQELAEINAPYDGFVEGVVPPGTQEENGSFPVLPRQPACAQGDPCDPNPFYGRVVYAPGLAIDQPLAVTRYEYRDSPVGAASVEWPRFSLSILWNARGQPAYGLFDNGAWARPLSLAAGQTACPVPGTPTDGRRCVLVQWPFMATAYDRARGRVLWPSWHGSILRNKQDGTGLEYYRNRVYDPKTGRFTQEDPLGLGGGVNLYGFANGDPANYSDPFGLCPACLVVAGAWALYESVSAAYDVYRAGKTVLDPAASAGKKIGSVALAAVGLVAPGGGYTALDDLADAAKAIDRSGLSAAGRALTKHAAGQRPGSSAFGRLRGSPAQINATAQEIVEDILTNPGTTSSVVRTGRFKGGTEFFDPSGRGIRYDANGRFVGFIERLR